MYNNMKGVPFNFGIIKSVLPTEVEHKVVMNKLYKNKISNDGGNHDDGLTYVYLYNKEKKLVDKYRIWDYIFDSATFKNIETKFKTEIDKYTYIEVGYKSSYVQEIYEFNKTDKRWYMTWQADLI